MGCHALISSCRLPARSQSLAGRRYVNSRARPGTRICLHHQNGNGFKLLLISAKVDLCGSDNRCLASTTFPGALTHHFCGFRRREAAGATLPVARLDQNRVAPGTLRWAPLVPPSAESRSFEATWAEAGRNSVSCDEMRSAKGLRRPWPAGQ